jgi:hypothetical protein
MKKKTNNYKPKPKSFFNFKTEYPDGLDSIPDYLKEKIDLAIEFVDGTSTDWFRIKPVLINMFPLTDRTRFSRRHYSTKKQILNLFDKAVINYWKEKTGVELWINPEKLHNPSWKRNPAGWGLFAINKERIENAKKKKQQQKTTKTNKQKSK